MCGAFLDVFSCVNYRRLHLNILPLQFVET